jgi:N-acetylneuraminic acid mutarotase
MGRLPLGVMLLCAACGGDDGTSDPPPNDGTAGDGPSVTGRWATAPSLPAGPRQETGVAALEGRIYVVGGFAEGLTFVADVEALDVASMTWETVTSLPAPMHHVNVAAVEGRLYVVGYLRDDFAEIGDVWEYDATTRTWTRRTPMPVGTARGASGVAVMGSKIYVAGGLRGLRSVADFSAYDTTNDTWETLPSVPTPRDHLVAGAIGSRVHVIGGRNGGLEVHTGRVDIFDTATGLWSRGSPMPTSRAGGAAAVLDDRIYVFGGEGNEAAATGVFDDVESYDPATDSWSIHVPMPTPRHGIGAAALMGRIYVPGGANKDGFASVDTVQAFTP